MRCAVHISLVQGENDLMLRENLTSRIWVCPQDLNFYLTGSFPRTLGLKKSKISASKDERGRDSHS